MNDKDIVSRIEITIKAVGRVFLNFSRSFTHLINSKPSKLTQNEKKILTKENEQLWGLFTERVEKQKLSSKTKKSLVECIGRTERIRDWIYNLQESKKKEIEYLSKKRIAERNLKQFSVIEGSANNVVELFRSVVTMIDLGEGIMKTREENISLAKEVSKINKRFKESEIEIERQKSDIVSLKKEVSRTSKQFEDSKSVFRVRNTELRNHFLRELEKMEKEMTGYKKELKSKNQEIILYKEKLRLENEIFVNYLRQSYQQKQETSTKKPTNIKKRTKKELEQKRKEEVLRKIRQCQKLREKYPELFGQQLPQNKPPAKITGTEDDDQFIANMTGDLTSFVDTALSEIYNQNY